MSLKPERWFPIAVVITVVNLVSVPFAGAPWHAAAHAILAVGFGLWAQRLQQRARPGLGKSDTAERIADDVQQQLDSLQSEMLTLKRELSEAQERLDFAERILAQGAEARRLK